MKLKNAKGEILHSFTDPEGNMTCVPLVQGKDYYACTENAIFWKEPKNAIFEGTNCQNGVMKGYGKLTFLQDNFFEEGFFLPCDDEDEPKGWGKLQGYGRQQDDTTNYEGFFKDGQGCGPILSTDFGDEEPGRTYYGDMAEDDGTKEEEGPEEFVKNVNAMRKNAASFLAEIQGKGKCEDTRKICQDVLKQFK